jgi:hypothetical protein
MPAINWWAVVVAALVAFVASSVWYIVWGKELATVSPAFAESLQNRQPWKPLFVIAEHLVIALVLAYFIGRLGKVDWLGAVLIGVLLWVGLSAMQLISSMVWEKVPLKLAAIHAGDWLLKLIIISALVGMWR